jgi:hypothetical protein
VLVRPATPKEQKPSVNKEERFTNMKVDVGRGGQRSGLRLRAAIKIKGISSFYDLQGQTLSFNTMDKKVPGHLVFD